MPRPSGSRGNRLSAEEQMLEKQRAELLRKQQELESRLKKLPSVLEEQQEQQRRLTKLRAETAVPAISSDIRRLGRRRRPAAPRRLPSSQLYSAQIKALALFAVLLLILFLLWRAIPS